MSRSIVASLSLSFLLAGCTAMGGPGMHAGMGGTASSPAMMGRPGMAEGMPMMRHMQAIDANRDGMVSRAEFMQAQEAMYQALPKNSAGQVDMNAMASMCPMMGGMGGMGGMQVPPVRRP